MNGHVGIEMKHCPSCLAVDGWQAAHGLRYAAQNIRHEAVSEEELDLADMCQWVAETHYPVDGKCVACGEDWDGAEAYPDMHGALQCSTFINARIEKNFWLMRKVGGLVEKWRHVNV